MESIELYLPRRQARSQGPISFRNLGRSDVSRLSRCMINATCQVVQFEFLGGPYDGLIVRRALCGTGCEEGGGLLWQTDGGRPGTEFWMPTEYALAILA